MRRARSTDAKNGVRAALVRAGRELMTTPGETPISLRGIARHAGYSAGVIYRYFPDREALFAAIRDREIEAFVNDLETRLAEEPDAERQLRLIADRSFAFSRQQIDTFGMTSLFLAKPDYLSDNRSHMPQRDVVPSAARVHRLYEVAIAWFLEPATLPAAELALAVASFMASISGAVMLPAGSLYGDFPDGVDVMHRLIDALINKWRKASD